MSLLHHFVTCTESTFNYYWAFLFTLQNLSLFLFLASNNHHLQVYASCVLSTIYAEAKLNFSVG